MNSLPFAFYDAMTRSFASLQQAVTLSGIPNCCSELSGLIGAVASENNQKLAFEYIKIDRGQSLQAAYLTWSDKSELASMYPNYRRCTAFIFQGPLEEPSNDAIVAYRNVSDITLCIYTSTINKQFLDRIYSLRFVSALLFGPGSANLIPGMMRNFVRRKTIDSIAFTLDYVIDKSTETLLLDLLKQEQLSWCHLPAKSTSTLRSIIADWKENSEKFVGKKLLTGMKAGSKHFEVEVQAGRIRECTEDEKHVMKLYYGWIRWENPQISTNQKGGAIYWNCNTGENVELLFA